MIGAVEFRDYVGMAIADVWDHPEAPGYVIAVRAVGHRGRRHLALVVVDGQLKVSELRDGCRVLQQVAAGRNGHVAPAETITVYPL